MAHDWRSNTRAYIPPEDVQVEKRQYEIKVSSVYVTNVARSLRIKLAATKHFLLHLCAVCDRQPFPDSLLMTGIGRDVKCEILQISYRNG